ncbi:MAG: TolC family protein [Flavobacteriaceae bacterium]|jgi:outer membrane protein|nr:TolC family protein [Flavobacteriaceae bacterium]MBT4113185.1 TolC family protein [Flavobacteriaceae bacterium]MBT4614664.1 TolC family protein [Flavobacteriaceae bacterium]MBT5245962.1 TolC family protein [Flavobacteriaceae bacterium]MBT5650567.1 TolC family protein [Flavobacteriaceae bacterium]
MKIIKVLALLIGLGAFAQSPLDRNQAIKLTLENNLNIKLIENSRDMAKNNASILNSGYLPTASLNSSSNISYQDIEIVAGEQNGSVEDSKNESNSTNISLNYVLFDGMGRKYNYKRFKEIYKKSEIEVKDVIEKTILQLFGVYYEVARLIEENKIIKSSLSISKERLKKRKIQLEYGQTTGLEVLNAEVDMNLDSINYLNSLKILSNAKRDLNLVMNIDLNTNHSINTDFRFITSEKMIDIFNNAKKNNSYLQILEKDVLISDYNLKATKSSYLPTIGLNGSYGWNESINDNQYAFYNENRTNGLSGAISLNWNIFNGGNRITNNKNAKLNLTNSKIKKQKIELEFERDIKNAYSNYENSLFILNAQQMNLETNNNNFKRNQEKYALGQVTSIEFRKAQLNFLNAKLSVNKAKFEAKLSELQVLQLAGEILTYSYE